MKIVGPLSKVKPCTRRDPKIGKKTLENCDKQNFYNQVNAVVGAHMGRKTETNGKQQLDNPNQDRQFGNLFSASTYDFTEPPGKLGILLSGPTLWATDFSLRSSHAAVRNISYSREGAVACLACTLFPRNCLTTTVTLVSFF